MFKKFAENWFRVNGAVMRSASFSMVFYRIFLLASAALISGTARADGNFSQSSNSTGIYIEEISCDTGKFSLRLPDYLPDLLKISKVISNEVVDRQNYGDYTTERRHISFDGLRLGILSSSKEPLRYLVTFAEITGPTWRIAGPFVIGDSVKLVQGQIGALAKQDGKLKKSYKGDGASIDFIVSNGKITKIEYSCYTG